MLNKWKAEKEKRKQEEKNKAKPLFKVCHVPVEIKANLQKNTPMIRTNVESKSNQQKTRQAVNSVQKNTSLRKADMKKETVSSKTNINTKAKCFPAKSKINEKIGKETNSEKPVINVVGKKSNNKTGTPAKIPRTPKKNKIQFDDGNSIVNENKKLRSIEKTGENSRTCPKRRETQIVDSDDEVLSKDIDKRTPKTNKRYNKTPRKGEKAVSIDDVEVEDIVKTDVEPKSPATPKNNKIPDSESALPVYNLDDLKANNWQAIIPESKPVVKRGRGRPKKINSTSSLKNIIMEARKKKKTEGYVQPITCAAD
ncbi:hypothetical protein NQ317_014834 [Molorchus minor]|uniref:Uncharacterized protein n=1 Tax=Molorchus minor TaxID=1323400 RepID=A0ABQ9JSC7_9CUCU|nr:hypothetical protein NQ317_014834 [Molorchus minor]